MAVSEEKASSDLENSVVKEKFTDSTPEKLEDSDVKSDAMLDEIAAKVEALDFSKIQEDEDGGDFHAKCMETVKKQGETINTLVQQLRIMFDEYQAIDQEREYYEDLNDALIRCLELTEGKIQFDSEESDKETEEDITHLISKESEEICISQEKEEENTLEKNSEIENEVETKEVGATATAADETDGDNAEVESTKSEVKVLAKSELIRLNRILLCEIFELRHQIDVMKENIREYFDETDGSEYDTATDDEHACEHCAPTDRHDVTVNKDENDDGKITENTENKNEEYEILENEEDTKIKDESDTE